MEHDPHRDPPPPAPSIPDRTHWTPAKQRVFLTELMETGNVAGAARAAGMSRSSAHRLRRRLAGTVFDATWGATLRLHAEAVADPFNAPSQTIRQSRDRRAAEAEEAQW